MTESDEAWWNRTWVEREELPHAHYGPTRPSDYPQGHVFAFPEGASRMRAPGGVYRPSPGGGRPGARPDAGFYVSHGLTQPLDEETLLRERAEGNDRFSFGWEFAIELGEPAEWAGLALAYLSCYSRDPDTPRLQPGSATTTHVLALPVGAGIGQRNDPLRETVTADPKWAAEWDRIHGLEHNAVIGVLCGD